jgi:hypothetical protein
MILKHKMGGKIYCVYNKNSDKIYIGRTKVNLSKRFKAHYNDYLYFLKTKIRNTHCTEIFENGGDTVIMCILNQNISDIDLKELEKRYIDWFDCVNNKKASYRTKLDPYDFKIPHEYLSDASIKLNSDELLELKRKLFV